MSRAWSRLIAEHSDHRSNSRLACVFLRLGPWQLSMLNSFISSSQASVETACIKGFFYLICRVSTKECQELLKLCRFPRDVSKASTDFYFFPGFFGHMYPDTILCLEIPPNFDCYSHCLHGCKYTMLNVLLWALFPFVKSAHLSMKRVTGTCNAFNGETGYCANLFVGCRFNELGLDPYCPCKIHLRA